MRLIFLRCSKRREVPKAWICAPFPPHFPSLSLVPPLIKCLLRIIRVFVWFAFLLIEAMDSFLNARISRISPTATSTSVNSWLIFHYWNENTRCKTQKDPRNVEIRNFSVQTYYIRNVYEVNIKI